MLQCLIGHPNNPQFTRLFYCCSNAVTPWDKLHIIVWKHRSSTTSIFTAGVKIHFESKTSFLCVLQIMLSLPFLSIKGCQKHCRALSTCCSPSDTAGNEVESSLSALTASFCIHNCCPVKNKLVCFRSLGDSFMFWGAFRASHFLYVAKGPLHLSELVVGRNQASGWKQWPCVCAEYYMNTWQQLHIQRSRTPAQSHRVLQYCHN